MINVNDIMRELAQYMRMQEEISETIEGLKDDLKQIMQQQNVDTLIGDEHKATFKSVTCSRIDTTAFKKAFPSMAEQFTKTSTTKRFTFI